MILGAAKGYEDILLGYTARSRQQSLDRRNLNQDDERKVSVNTSSEHQGRSKSRKEQSQSVAGQAENIQRPPAAPRRKRENKI